MLILGVLSDTHFVQTEGVVPSEIFEALKDADYIVHCGDINQYWVMEQLESIAPVLGVYGNTDPFELVSKLPHKRVLRLAGYEIGITHGEGEGLACNNALQHFRSHSLDLLLFGHSHCPESHRIGRTLCFNPGSATKPRCSEQGSIGLVYLGDHIQTSIQMLKRRAI